MSLFVINLLSIVFVINNFTMLSIKLCFQNRFVDSLTYQSMRTHPRWTGNNLFLTMIKKVRLSHNR